MYCILNRYKTINENFWYLGIIINLYHFCKSVSLLILLFAFQCTYDYCTINVQIN